MRRFVVLIMIGQVVGAPLAFAEAWRAKPVLEPSAPIVCRDADVSNLFFELVRTEDQLSVTTNTGEAFSAPVNAEGFVATVITVPVGNKTFAVDLSGNVNTREMEVFNKRYSCRFKLAPISSRRVPEVWTLRLAQL